MFREASTSTKSTVKIWLKPPEQAKPNEKCFEISSPGCMQIYGTFNSGCMCVARKKKKLTCSSCSLRANLSFPLASASMFRLSVHQNCSFKKCFFWLVGCCWLFFSWNHSSSLKLWILPEETTKIVLAIFFFMWFIPNLNKDHVDNRNENFKFCLMWNFSYVNRKTVFLCLLSRRSFKKEEKL